MGWFGYAGLGAKVVIISGVVIHIDPKQFILIIYTCHVCVTLIHQREWLGVADRGRIRLEPVSIPRSSSLIGNLSLEVDFNKVPK